MADDFDRLYRALDDKTVNPLCPVCGHNDWRRGKDFLAAVPGIKPGESIGKRHFQTLPLICGNCGFMRLHATGALS